MTFEDTIWLARGYDGVTRSPLEFPDDLRGWRRGGGIQASAQGRRAGKVTVGVMEIPDDVEAAQ